MTLEIMDFEEFQKKKTIQLQNPLLLGVKMFLADVIYLVNMPYDINRRTCSDFALDVQNAASKQGIRCGYVIINFEGVEAGHAIVAFETDYGLKFFEPQSADEKDVIIGRRYSARLAGNVNEKIITKVEILWNDGTNAIME
jgi:hypothetical protein